MPEQNPNMYRRDFRTFPDEKNIIHWFKVHLRLLQRVHLRLGQPWIRWWLVRIRRQGISSTNCDQVLLRNIDALMQKRCTSLEVRPFCIKPQLCHQRMTFFNHPNTGFVYVRVGTQSPLSLMTPFFQTGLNLTPTWTSTHLVKWTWNYLSKSRYDFKKVLAINNIQ